jgi:RimJ/RimL family protein N-acetyltransferase
MKRSEPGIVITELAAEDLPFLLALWHTAEVMRYADEFPRLRGWSKKDDPQTAWTAYQERRAALGNDYVQFILRLTDGTRIGESFFTPLPDGYTLARWRNPNEITCLMGDIKLLRPYWGQGLATKGMQQVVKWLFAHSPCDWLVVPPHRKNPAAERVYQKAGFELVRGMASRQGHRVMTLLRDRYERGELPRHLV